jgi:hypothetical protein
MSGPGADAHILSGVAEGDGAGWRRWTEDKFSLVFKPLPEGPWRARLRFEIHEPFLKTLGPFTVQLGVNGRPLAMKAFGDPGDVELAVDIPPGLIQPGRDVRIDVSADKAWIAPEDGARLSLRLIAAGFSRP